MPCFRWAVVLAVTALACGAATSPLDPTTNSLVALGSAWKYLDDGSDQGTNWVTVAFDDSSWSNGIAQFGYGDGDEATVVRFGPNPASKYVTTYFRRHFVVDNPALVQDLSVNVLRDDGAVVYINGQDVFRPSMPPTHNYLTFATEASEYPFQSTVVSPTVLVAGTNIIAVEVHQGSAGSSDMSFELELIAVIAPPSNFPPLVSLTNPPNNTTLAAPANVSLAASASDPDGTVTNVAFYSNGVRLANDTSSPYAFAWNNIPAGIYALTAVATEAEGLSATSSVVNLTISTNTAPPTVTSKSPAPGTLTNLTSIIVTFSKNVTGVNASDLLINGVPATGVSGAGQTYTFTFPQPAYGNVNITWSAAHGITDVFTPPSAFNATGPNATWQYQLNDTIPPLVTAIDPVPGSTVAALTSIWIMFDEPVTGVGANDLLMNALPAISMSGSGRGPYAFDFTQPSAGPIQIAWAAAHGIQDVSGNAFAGGAWSYTLDPNASGIIISEIMYHPQSENPLEEYIELFNKGATPVNLNGWRFSGGVEFTFPNVTVPGGGYLAVAANVPAFTAKYPGVTNVVGGWIGILNNSHEDLDLDDALGNRIDSVEYADEGDWAVRQRGPLEGSHRGWVWLAEHDGLGKSLELSNPNLSNNAGQNWASSRPTNGTPGRANSALTNNIAPMILGANHTPIVPRSTDAVSITARLVDETANSFSVTLFYRINTASPPPFNTLVMRDDGTSGDAVSGDGLYTATLNAMPNNSVVEYYLAAVDQQGAARTWPAAALTETGASVNAVNALFQIDDLAYAGTQPLYKIIMTEAERAELAQIPSQSNLQGPNSQMNGTFISIDPGGASSVSLRYLASIRNRGHGSRTAFPPNYRVNFRSDEVWKDVTGINLNTRQVHIQHFGSVLARKSGVAGANSTAVQVRVNNANLATTGAPMFGSYAANEANNGDWAENHFPFDGDGNIYRAVRDIAPPDFSYRGENKNSYTNTWFKQSNASEDDWTDLIGMLRVIGINNSTPFTTETAREVINVEQWLRHLAVMNLMGNAESGLNSGYNDDYYMYRGLIDPRFILMYYDLDQILGQGGSFGTGSGLFTATQNNGSGQAMNRLMRHPDFEPIYYRLLRELIDTSFSQVQFNALVDQTLSSYVPGSVINSIKSWMDQRRTFVLSQLPPPAPVAPIATITGVPRSPTPRTAATLTVGGEGVTHYQYSLNGGAFGPETIVSTAITLSGLSNGTNTVAVIGRNADGIWQDVSNATVVTWLVNTAWPAVRINEVLARNDSAVNHSGTFPDLIELFNESSAAIDLSGMRLTDDPANPNKFIFPNGTTLSGGGYLTVYANNPDATSGIHVGFSLDQNGEGVYLFHRVSSGGNLLDAVEFGLQLPNLSIARVHGGEWSLSTPAFNAPNAALPMGDARNVRINEWLTASVTEQDFVELHNPDAAPAGIGGLFLTDEPIGAPMRHRIAPLSFMGANSFTVFTADADPDQGAEHLNFRLALEMGEIALFNASGAIIDCVTYGPQQPDVSRGRCPDGALQQRPLNIPTPGGPNACPIPPPPSTLVNLITISNVWKYEQSGVDLGTNWIAPAYDDTMWPEGQALLGFDSATLPEPFRTQLTLANGKWTFYFRTHFNLAANVNVSGLELTHILDDGVVLYLNGVELYRYNMPGGSIVFSTPASSNIGDAAYQGPFVVPILNLQPGDNVLAAELHQATAASGDLAFGLRLDGVIATNNPGAAGVLINEVLANNATLEEPDGSKPDWVEIFNPSTTSVDLADMSLSDSTLLPRRWVFPSGSLLAGGGFLRVRFDGDAPVSPTNTGFGLKASGDTVYLFNRLADGGGVASAITFGLQAADFTIGRVPDGSANWVLAVPSPASANIAGSLGDAARLMINEWLANPASGEDWFEIYNPNGQPVDISRFHLTDDLNARLKHQLPPLSFIGTGPSGFQRFEADGVTSAGADHVNFSLRASGEALGISTPTGVLLNGVSFGAQANGVSQGRLPDGTANFVNFATTQTPGKSNFLPLDNVFVNELLSHSDPPLEDAVEFYNASGDDVDIGGWYLSDSQNNLLKYRIPAGTIIPAGRHVVFYEYQFNTDHPGELFSFSSARGDEVYLSQASAPAVLTGYRAFAEFSPAANGVSFGRFLTSASADFTAMSARTFGVDNPGTPAAFRLGTGLTNVYPKVGPVVINEIMYHPASTNDALEFVELHNILGTSVPLFDAAHPNNTWRLRKGVDFNFPPGTTLPAGGYLVLVSFNPQTDANALAAFQAAYGSGMTLLGPYSGKLDNAGEPVELQRPDAPQTIPGPDFGLVPYIAVDRVEYRDVAPWPATPDGTGHSLKRTTASLYGNEPLNWSGGTPTAGASNGGGGGPTNTPPTLGAIGNRNVVEGALLAFTAAAVDTDSPAQTLTFSLDAGGPSGAAINAGSGAFTWTPTEAQGPGIYSITVRVTDSGSPVLSDAETISITVTETNAAPVLTPIGNKAVAEGSLVTFTATATDSDVPAQALTYTLAAGAPGGASLDPVTGVFNWTPTEAQGPGTYSVTVRVTDNGTPNRTDSETIEIAVSEANNRPTLAPVGNRVASEGTQLSFTASATDSDLPAQTLTFTLDSGAPSGATINPTSGAFTWTPTESQGGTTNTITIRVTDNGSPATNDFETITIVVNEVNARPVLVPIGNKVASEGTQLAFTATATDSDLPTQVLTFTLDSGAPSGATINPTTGAFTWTPTESQGGTTNTLTVRVTDNGSPATNDFETITIVVSEVNARPVLAPIGNRSASEGTQLSFTATATDSDLPAQTLTFTLDSGAPSGAAINPTTGAFTWTPTESQGGTTNTLTVRVTDNGSPATNIFETITIVVSEANNRPILAPIGNRTASEGTQLSFTATATDSDLPAQVLTFTLDSGAPSGATINPTTGAFTWTPTESQGGTTNTITVRVTDNGSPATNDFETITIVVSEVNARPVLAAIGNRSASEGTQLSFTATATDSDLPAQALTFSLDAGAPSGATINPTTGAFTWTPTESQGGTTNTITIRVTDNGSPATNDFETITIVVNEVNARPVLAPIGNKTVSEGTQLSFTATATDGDLPAQALTFTLDAGAPSGATINPTTGAFTWTPTESQGGTTNTITIHVTDNGSPATNDFETITIVVNEVNARPVLAPIGNRSASEGTQLSFIATATDSDVPGQALTFTLDSGAPSGATINPTTGAFAWTPTESQGGTTNTITVRVTDNGSPATNDFETITIVVDEVNSAPVLAAIANQTNSPGSTINLTATATDPDAPAQALMFALDPGAPSGASINPTSGVFSWTPTPAQVPSTNVVTVRVTDSGLPALDDSRAFTIYVLGAFRVVNFQVSPAGAVTLTWNAIPGKTYRVQHSASLDTSANWNNLGGPLRADDTTATRSDNVGTNTTRFYRILQTD